MTRGAPVEPPRILLFHKPYGVLTQFTDEAGRPTLADYVREPGLYAAGRLDADSEGLLILTSTAWVKSRLTDPAHETPKTYWAQVEVAPGVDVDVALEQLRAGVELSDGPTRPARARRLDPEAKGGPHAAPGLVGMPRREPPVQPRAGRETTWIELTITEGRNRQVRRMGAAVGLPTLRLIRVGVGPWRLDGLASGAVRRIDGIPAELFRRARRA